MSELPAGWAISRLGDVFRWSSGGTPRSTDSTFYGGDVPWAVIGDLKDGVVTSTESTITQRGLESSAAKWVEPGSVLVAMYGSIGKAGIAGTRLTTNQAIAFTKPDPMPPKYLFWFIKHRQLALAGLGKGATQKNISQTVLNDVPFPVPPFAEQHRIVEKLEELLSDRDAGVTALERARANLKRYRAAVLKAAVEGRLTEKWRAAHPDVEPASKLLERILAERRKKWEEAQLKKYADKGQSPPKGWKDKYSRLAEPDVSKLPELPRGWCWMTLDQLADIGTGATPLRSEQMYWREGSIAWVTSAAVNDPYVHEASELVTPAALAETNLFVYPKHTLILAMYGEGKTRGKVSELLIEATTNQALAALVFEGTSAACQQYAKTYLAKSYEDMRRIAAGGVQPNLNLGLIREMCVAIPPLSEQSEIVAMVDRQLSVQQRLVDESQKSALRGASLRQAILKRAFEGKLVPQDPKDEPASELLARIRAVRAGEGKGKRRARGGEGGAV